ncbi:hypothetical protein T484DRAFT_1937470 [Baffinella frigidus]|nr:hypothetical protein T484DRAFT_1937470 [Cryptophyta sp. CCMP2293]
MQRAAPALLAVLAFLSAAHAFCPAPAALRPPSVAGSAQLGRVLGRLSSPGSCRGAGGGTVRGFVPRVARGGVVALRAQAEEVAGEVLDGLDGASGVDLQGAADQLDLQGAADQLDLQGAADVVEGVVDSLEGVAGEEAGLALTVARVVSLSLTFVSIGWLFSGPQVTTEKKTEWDEEELDIIEKMRAESKGLKAPEDER